MERKGTGKKNYRLKKGSVVIKPVISFFTPNLLKLKESNCYFVRNLVFLLVLVMKLPLTTSAESPGLTPGMVELFFPPSLSERGLVLLIL